MTRRVDELERLQRLRDSGALTEEEFQAEKRRALGTPPGSVDAVTEGGMRTRAWLWIVLALAGIAAAIVAGIFLGREVGPKQEASATNGQQSVSINLSDDVLNVAAPQEDVRMLPAEEQLKRAFAAAFGEDAGLAVDGERVEFKPGGVLWTGFGPVLVSEGEVKDAAHVSSGKVAVHYLRPAGGGFEVAHSFVPAVEAGSFGKISSWTLSRKFTDNPVIYTSGGGTWQGNTCSWSTLTELTPSGPRKLVTVPMSYSNGGAIDDGDEAIDIKGRITNVVKGRSFDVQYGGSRSFTDHYVRTDGTFSIEGGESTMDSC